MVIEQRRNYMANGPFTIRIFVPDGDPEGVRLIDRMDWTGHGIVFPREKWPTIKQRPKFARTGVYILSGYEEGEEDVPTIYVGEGDVIRDRIESHFQNKKFWDRAIAFTATNHSLYKTHVRWLEQALVDRAKQAGRCKLDNATEPKPPPINEADRADIESFLKQILQILPLMDLRAFETPKVVIAPQESSTVANTPVSGVSRKGILLLCRHD
jgi:hypothetical protein